MLPKNQASKMSLSRSDITPEMAAFVVKEYLLPMFEQDGKKQTSAKKPISKLGSPDEEHNASQENLLQKDYTQFFKSSTTVLSELKLSKTLLNDNRKLKNELKLQMEEN